MASPSQLDVLVVTAVPVEKEAARKVIEKAGCAFTKRSWRESTSRLDYDEGMWQYRVGSTTANLKIGLTKLTGAGCAATNNLISQLREAITLAKQSKQPVKLKCVAMVGVCAGNPNCDRLTLGDIIVPRSVATTGGKKTPEGLQPDGKMVSQTFDIMQAVDSAKDFWGTGKEGASSNNWVDYLPDDVKDAPSPDRLQQAIKAQLQDDTSSEALYDKLTATYKLPSSVQSTDVEEALEKLCSAAGSMVRKKAT